MAHLDNGGVVQKPIVALLQAHRGRGSVEYPSCCWGALACQWCVFALHKQEGDSGWVMCQLQPGPGNEERQMREYPLNRTIHVLLPCISTAHSVSQFTSMAEHTNA